jgi:hypothetical protein
MYQLIFVFLFPIFAIAAGLVLIFNKDLAWRMVEPILRHVKPQRTHEWERYSTINGVIIVSFGLVALLFILSLPFG